MSEELITQPEFARLLGVRRQNVTMMIKRGQVTLIDGKINPAAAARDLFNTSHPGRWFYRRASVRAFLAKYAPGLVGRCIDDETPEEDRLPAIDADALDAWIDRYSIELVDALYAVCAIELKRIGMKPARIWHLLLALEREHGQILGEFFDDHRLPAGPTALYRLCTHEPPQRKKFLDWLSEQK